MAVCSTERYLFKKLTSLLLSADDCKLEWMLGGYYNAAKRISFRGELLGKPLGSRVRPAFLLADDCSMRVLPAKLEEFTAFFLRPGSELRDTFESSFIFVRLMRALLAADFDKFYNAVGR